MIAAINNKIIVLNFL